MVEKTDIIQRVFGKKEEIKKSTQRIIDIAVDSESIYREGNITQIKNEINTILSCIAELKAYASFFEKYRVSKIKRGGTRIIVLLNNGLVTPVLLDVFCVAVNSIEIKPTKKSVKVVVGGDLGRLKMLISKEESNF